MDGAITLEFDFGLPYMAADQDRRVLPRLPLSVASPQHDTRAVTLWPLLDTGAQWTLFDGAIALELGWSEADIVGRAEDAQPISGVARGGSPLIGYLHRLTCYVPLGPRFGALSLRAFLTPPYTLGTPVLGRLDFFQQVDFALVDAEQRVVLRVRDRSAIHESWPDAP